VLPLRPTLGLLAALLLTGCPPVVVEFPFGEGDDDDSALPPDDDDDDDTATPVDEPPVLELVSRVPAAGWITEGVTLNLNVTDADSTEVTWTVEYTLDGTEWHPASTSGETGVATVAAPLNATAQTTWEAADDVDVPALGATLRLCPTDGDGDEGSCIDVGDLDLNPGASPPTGSLCDEGALEDMAWSGGQAYVPLSDGDCVNRVVHDPPQPDDFAARFLLVLVNPEASAQSFSITPTSELPANPPVVLPPGTAGAGGTSLEWDGLPDDCEPDLGADSVHEDTRTFQMRETIESDTVRTTRGATLRALGEHVAIYVDDETPLDIDPDCASDDPFPEDSNPAFGFDSCDLQAVVDVFDINVYPRVTDRFGAPSDVDANCRVTVLLSHRVNRLTSTDDDPSNDAFAVKSFAEPEIDLWEASLADNPGSNEQEIIYLYAPDPAGLWSDEEVPLAAYLDFSLAGQMAIALQDLVSYAHHVGVTDTLMATGTPAGDPEEDWLADAMGLLAADVAGFGSVAYRDAWVQLDRSHLLPLVRPSSLGAFEDRGGQYLLARYLHDLYGDEVIAAIVDSPTTGAATLEEVTGRPFEALLLDWATAMATSGRLDSEGAQLVGDDVVPNFHEPSTMIVPDPPLAGDPYGAHGFQQGFDVRGPNLTFTGGTDPDGPTELPELRVRTENLDPLVFHPQADFFGTVAANYGVVVVLVDGLEQPINHLLVETSSGADLVGRVVRIQDGSPLAPPLTLEDVDGALLTTLRALGELDPTRERRVIGRIDPPEPIDVALSIDPEAAGAVVAYTVAEVADTDGFTLTLAATTHLGIQVDRRYSGLGGEAALADPWAAVVPASDLPDPWAYEAWGFGPTSADGPCGDPDWYDYPYVVPQWLFDQGLLSDDPSIDVGFEPLAGPPGSALGTWDCLYDHDQDGVLDIDEAMPLTFPAQVLQRQAEHLAVDPDFYALFDAVPDDLLPVDATAPFFGPAFIDLDSTEYPDDEFETSLPWLGLGGRAVQGGEEATWHGVLPPGDYVVVVGGTASTGAYDLSVRFVAE